MGITSGITRAVLFFTLCYVAVATAGVEDIRRLYESGKPAEAYNEALKLLDEEEGNAAFDLWYALSAIETGKIDRAVFALERVLMQFPQHLRARLELGRAYFIMGDFDAAKRSFQQVLAQRPPASVASRIEQFLQQIEQREKSRQTQLAAQLSAGFGYDSNINLATDLSTIDVPAFGSLTLGRSSRETSGYFRELGVDARLQRALSKTHGLFASLGVQDHNNNGSNDLDTINASLSGGYGRIIHNDRYEASLQYQRLYLDSEMYRNTISAGMQWMRNQPEDDDYSLFAQVGRINYVDTATRNANFVLMGGAWSHALASDRDVSVGGFYGYENVLRDVAGYLGRQYYGVSAGLQWRYSPQHTFSGSVVAQGVRYNDTDQVFSKTRQDEYVQLALGWNNRLSRAWSLRTKLELVDNNSNIDLYTYDRKRLLVTLAYTIQ